jgi:hypothetical protein
MLFHKHVEIHSRDLRTDEDCLGSQRIYKFKNGYGASVVSHKRSYGGKDGLYELAVLRDDEIVYNTPITSDVIGWLSMGEAEQVLQQVKNLSWPDRRTRLWAKMARR